MKLKMMIKSLVYIVLAIICIINLLPLIEVINKSTYDWIVQAFDTLSSFLFNEETTGTFSALFSKEFWQLPELFQIIFGTGHSLYNADGYSHSDVGYINDLWFVGIVGMSLVYGSIALLLIRAVKTIRNNMYKICMLFMGVSALVFNIKASVIGYNPGVTTMLSMIFVMLYFNSANKEMVEKKVHSFKEYHLKKNNYRR